MENNKNNFVHLNVHTSYSIKDSLIRIPSLVSSTKERGMHAVAISDSSNLYASIKLYKEAMSKGIKPIIACQLNVMIDGQVGYMTAIAKNNTGYKNIIQVISDAYESGDIGSKRDPVVDFEELKKISSGIVLLSGARNGPLGQSIIQGRDDISDGILLKLKSTFGNNFFLELQRMNHKEDDIHVHKAVEKAIQFNMPVVATNPVMFLNADEYKTHEIRVACAQSITVEHHRQINPDEYSPEQFLKSPDEMANIFYDIPSALENSVEIARSCNIDIELGKSYLPAFPDAINEGKTEEEYLREASLIGLEKRLESILDKSDPDYQEKRKVYDDRLQFELNVVEEMGFPGYFLIVMEFIQWSKANDIPVGPGRGSGAGSLIAYATDITDLDPLQYNLLFERFLNPERVSMPDFDIDFCMDRREEVIQHTAEKYGKDAVSQITTFGTMAAKMVVRDVARALGYPYSVGNRISQMIIGKPGIKLAEAIEGNTEFEFAIENDPDVKAIIEHSLKMEGLVRQTGKHAGGVVIAPGKLTKHTATFNEFDKAGNVINKVSQLDKNDVEEAGMVKFDFLGLKTLTIINNAMKVINKERKSLNLELLDISKIKLDEKEVFENYTAANTTAVFQVESKGMKDLLKKIKPDCFEDIIALVALFRPGPLESGMVDNFINRKHGREKISYPDANYEHESLKEILEPTYGIILYQEQVMQIAQVLSGYSLGEADMLRRAMGKKKPEEMAKQREGFEKGAIENGVDGHLAMKIFDLVEKFAGYGFNKSHSAAYALVSYQTIWLKTFYPSHFMAAALSADMDDMDKIVTYVNDCREIGVEILPPDINKSMTSFTPNGEKSILFGMGAIKGVGDSAIEQIMNERNLGGDFKSLFDFCMRCKPKKTMIEPGIRSGLLDSLGPSRAALMLTYPNAVAVGKQAAIKEKDSPQMAMFGSLMDDDNIIKFEKTPDWSDLYRLSGERKTLGLYLTGHPIETYENELSNVISGKLIELIGSNLEDGNEELEESENTEAIKWEDKNVTVAGLIMDIDVKNGKKGQTAFLTIDDKSRQVDVMIFNKQYHECQHLLEPDTTVIIEGRLKMDKRTKRIRLFAFDVKSVDMIRERSASNIHLELNDSNFNPHKKEQLKALIESQPTGYAGITARYRNNEIDKSMTLGDYEVKINDEFINGLRDIFGKESVSVNYKQSSKNKGPVVNKAKTEEEKANKLEEGQKTKERRHYLMSSAFNEARTAMSG